MHNDSKKILMRLIVAHRIQRLVRIQQLVNQDRAQAMKHQQVIARQQQII